MNITAGRNGAVAPRSRRVARTALAAALGLLPLTWPALAADAAGAEPIVASLNPPPEGLSCDQAAAATSVYFQFANPPFQISQLSLYLDGKGVAQDAIDEHWPTVTMKSGLHAGTNTVDIVANGDNGQHIERRMVVQVGGTATDSAGVAQVSCNDAVAQAPQTVPQPYDGNAPPVADAGEVAEEPPEPVVVEQSPPVVYEEPAPVVYDYPAPVYVYNPYPVVAIDPWVPFVPLFGFGFFYSHYHPWYSPPRVVVNNYYHGGGGGWGGGYHGGGWNGGGWHGNPGWNGGRGPYPAPGGNSGWHGAPRPGPAPQPAYNNGPRPAAPNGGYRPAPNGGWRPPAPNGGYRPAPAPRQPAAEQRHQSYWQGGGGRQFAAAPQYRPQQNFQNYHPVQQYRPAPQQGFRPAAPQFHGGGGGGGFHAAPSGGHGGGGGGGRHH